MPFIGRDWRSPGEAWVKTETLGWQRMKIIESQLYPSCHQTSPACSWPPKSEYGQHLYNHCRNGHETSDRIAGADGMRAGSLESSSSSSDSSRGSSLSPSPSSSPEKNTLSSHHIYHPIAISSPYGWHSCIAHQQPPETACDCDCGNRLMASTVNCCTPSVAHRNRHQLNQGSSTTSTATDRAKVMSLSRESLQAASIPTRAATGRNGSLMRYNRSVSDFRNSSSSRDDSNGSAESGPHESSSSQQQRPIGDKTTSQQIKNDTKYSNSLSPPTLMKNGQLINSSSTDEQQLQFEPAASDADLDAEQSDRQHEQQPALLAIAGNKQPASSSSSNHGNCCCCSAAGGHGNFYPTTSREPNTKTAPHCRISVRTREVAMYNTISEAFYRLDFCNAIHDIRRFNYICKLLHLLITQSLTSLSGCATKVLFTMLEQVAWEVSNNKRNIHILKNLLKDLRQMIEKYYCWGRPIGSSLLWQQHFETIERISAIVDGIELAPPKSDEAAASNRVTFNDLPVEMIREILLRLNDYRDLVSSSQASPVMQIMIDNQLVWQKLCRYHFTEQQLRFALDSRNSLTLMRSGSCRNTTAAATTGVKYARTASADGRSSYRKPVNQRQLTKKGGVVPSSSSSSNGGTSTGSSSKQRRDQASQKQPQQSRGGCCPVDADDAAASDHGSSSYVTRAIRIFDGEGSSTTLGLAKTKTTTAERANEAMEQHSDTSAGSAGALPPIASQSQRRQSRPSTTSSSSNSSSNTATNNNASNTSNNLDQTSARQPNHQRAPSGPNAASNSRAPSSSLEIDWERVFHQLRKKFDLKEEYPDCLLLCRHCRCLFWKSFGHPCIKNDDNTHTGGDRSTVSPLQQPSSATDSDGSLNQVNRIGAQARNGRPSVADLSRNFSERALREVGANRAQNAQNHPSHQPNMARRASNSSNNNYRPAIGANLDVPLGGQRLINQRLADENNNNNNSNNPAPRSSSARRDELIPKHVAISPQAFLKFFSL